MKFKIGDRVKVRRNLVAYKEYGKYSFVNDMKKMEGKIVTIKATYDDSYKIEEFDYCWTDEMFEDRVIFTKSDLKDGDIVTYRNGDKRTVINNKLTDEDGTVVNRLNTYKEDLTEKCGMGNLDIIKVERPVFERKEEILEEVEKRYLRNVIRPFREQIHYIEKIKKYSDNQIIMNIDGYYDYFKLPTFKENTMYKNMEINKKYTLKQLGL